MRSGVTRESCGDRSQTSRPPCSSRSCRPIRRSACGWRSSTREGYGDLLCGQERTIRGREPLDHQVLENEHAGNQPGRHPADVQGTQEVFRPFSLGALPDRRARDRSSNTVSKNDTTMASSTAAQTDDEARHAAARPRWLLRLRGGRGLRRRCLGAWYPFRIPAVRGVLAIRSLQGRDRLQPAYRAPPQSP